MVRLAMAVCVLVLTSVGTASAQTCLHGASETSAQKARRDQAIQVATRINMAQSVTIVPSPQGRRYRRFEELRNIPPIPQGFDLQFHTDGVTYSFSLKDRLDPCRYAIFSDQDRDVYEALPRMGFEVIPLETK